MVERVGGGVTHRHLRELEELVDELLGFLRIFYEEAGL